jgi:hypothetical protein
MSNQYLIKTIQRWLEQMDERSIETSRWSDYICDYRRWDETPWYITAQLIDSFKVAKEVLNEY